jgi:hypothetical protein
MKKTELYDLKDHLELALKAYIKAFEKKHGCELEHIVGDDLMGVLCFGDNFFNIGDVVYDIDKRLPKGMIYNWQQAMIEQHFKNPDATATNLMHWHMAHGGKK